jgi:hypothetical protein
MKAWCGYVGVPLSHPLRGIRHDKRHRSLAKAFQARLQQPMGDTPGLGVLIGCLCGNLQQTPECTFGVHGGITFSGWTDSFRSTAPSHWWFGFDCSHSGDLSPGLSVLGKKPMWPDEVYRTLDYARDECRKLADQLAAIATSP